MSLQAQYASVVKSPLALVSAANTGRDGTGTLVTLYTAGANGGRIDDLNMNALASTTAGMLRLFVSDGGANNRLVQEVPVQAVTPSGTVQAWASQLRSMALCLQAGYQLKLSTNNAESFAVSVVRGGDF